MVGSSLNHNSTNRMVGIYHEGHGALYGFNALLLLCFTIGFS